MFARLFRRSATIRRSGEIGGRLKPPFKWVRGRGWVVNIRAPDGDDVRDPSRSALILLEDGRELGPAHAGHTEIDACGRGRYSHWKGKLSFSTSDNSDPNVNGREYRWLISPERDFARRARYAADTVRSYKSHLGGDGIFAGRAVLEIGPGRELGTALLMACLGARVTCVEKYHKGWSEGFHDKLAEALLAISGEFPDLVSDAPLQRSLRSRGFDPETVTIAPIRLEDMREPPGALADFSVSHSVFEHFEDTAAALRNLRRACRPSARGAHQTDFRDHRDNQRPLEFLLLGDAEFERETGPYRYTHGNRIRLSDYRRLLIEAGFAPVEFRPNLLIDEAYLANFLPRLRASTTRYAAADPSDLRVLGGAFVLGAPTPSSAA